MINEGAIIAAEDRGWKIEDGSTVREASRQASSTASSSEPVEESP
jgi:hypothetical protein